MTVYFNPVACSKLFHTIIDFENNTETEKNSLITTKIERYKLLRRQPGNMLNKIGFVDKSNIVHFRQSQHLLVANAQHQ